MLLQFFAELRKARIPVTPREFLDLLRALDRDAADRSAEDFYRLSRTVLVKDERWLDAFDVVFAHVFKGALSLSQAVGAVDIPQEWLRKLIEKYLSPEERAEIEKLGFDKLMETLRQRLAEQKGRHQGGSKWIGTGGTSPFGAYGDHPEGVRIGQDKGRRGSAVKVWDKREFKDFAGDEELGPRNIRVALRRLRRFAREGVEEELDLDETIRSTADKGYIDVQMRPERRNAVKVLLFLDVGGSMDWHVEEAEALFSAARLQFKRLEHFYFHNCLYESVWKHNRRRFEERTSTADLLNAYGRDHRVIFVGDAAMSPHEILQPGGSVEHLNPEPGEVWLKRVTTTWPHSVWINPTPQANWSYSQSTRIIQALFGERMFPLTPDGIEQAMRALSRLGRGRRIVQQTWRWFGPDDPVTLPMIAEAGATGVVTALHQHNRGEVWPVEEIARRRAAIEAAGLTWGVVESIGVGEEIKTRSGAWRQKLDNYKQSLRNAARAGVKTFCYNFMAITDWTRTDLMWPAPGGGYALRFDALDFAAYDLFILERDGAERDYAPQRIAEARTRLETLSPDKRADLERTLIDWLPARDFTYDRASFREALARYAEVGAEDLRANLVAFVREIAEVADEEGVRLAIHPDDPAFPIFGLPRVMSSAADVRALFAAVPTPACGLTFCAGSFGSNGANDLPAMLAEFAPRVHFAHLRSVQREPDGSFHEANHLEGDGDLIALLAGLLREEARRRAGGRDDADIPMRPDHGPLIGGDDPNRSNPGYSYVGRLKGLAELRGAMRVFERFSRADAA